MTWIDAHRSAGFALAIITIAGMDLTVRGSRDPRTDASDSQRPASKRRPACVWPPRWRDVAREIMRLPVTVRDEPAAVSGEIAA